MTRRRLQSGSVTVLVTLSLFAMCGLLGLAVDLGWSYYVKKSAQAAADSGALAAVAYAKQHVSPPYSTCGTTTTTLYCNSTPIPCSSISTSSNVYSACQYAAQNGFQDGAGNVKVTVAANTTSPAPTVPNVAVTYWVTVRVNQEIPQLFSAVLGNSSGLVAARATAALTNVVFKASLDLLDRQNDPTTGMCTGCTGVNMNMQGGGNVQSPGGILLGSTLAGSKSNSTSAAMLGGSSSVSNTPFSWFRGGGTCYETNGNNCITDGKWVQPWTNGHGDGLQFWDPTASFKNPDQPSLSSSPDTTDRIVDVNTNKGMLGPNNPPGVTGSGTAGDPYKLPRGNYYAANCSGGATGTCTPTGGQVKFDNVYYQFGDGGSSFPAGNQWVFYGGLTTTGGNSTITFSPGRYVFAGTTNQNPSFYVDNGTTIKDTYAGSGYPGEIFLYTNPNYTTSATGNAGSLSVPAAIQSSGIQFTYGESGFKAGNSNNSSFSLHGLDQTNSPSDLQNWAPFLLWQDRGNSTVLYDSQTGQIVLPVGGSCGPGSSPEVAANGGTGLDAPCLGKPSPYPTAPQMDLQATPNTAMSGAVYQPRGAWLNMQGGGSITGSLQIITGALNNGGGGTVILTGISNPMTILATALIE